MSETGGHSITTGTHLEMTGMTGLTRGMTPEGYHTFGGGPEQHIN